MTITIGYWIIPLVVTAAAFFWCGTRPNRDQWGMGNMFDAIGALIVSLIAWLIWAVLT